MFPWLASPLRPQKIGLDFYSASMQKGQSMCARRASVWHVRACVCVQSREAEALAPTEVT